MRDEKLNELGDRFITTRVRELLNLPFETYVENPAYYDELIDALDQGRGLRLSDAGNQVVVELKPN